MPSGGTLTIRTANVDPCADAGRRRRTGRSSSSPSRTPAAEWTRRRVQGSSSRSSRRSRAPERDSGSRASTGSSRRAAASSTSRARPTRARRWPSTCRASCASSRSTFPVALPLPLRATGGETDPARRGRGRRTRGGAPHPGGAGIHRARGVRRRRGADARRGPRRHDRPARDRRRDAAEDRARGRGRAPRRSGPSSRCCTCPATRTRRSCRSALAGTETAFVQKPFTHDGLAAAVRELLDREDEPLGRAVGAHPHR